MPQLIHAADPLYSRQAIHDNVSGVVVLGLYVDQSGIPRNIHVEKGVGHGLDEQAILSVRQYRFAPAKKDGVPVAVEMTIQVSFQR